MYNFISVRNQKQIMNIQPLNCQQIPLTASSQKNNTDFPQGAFRPMSKENRGVRIGNLLAPSGNTSTTNRRDLFADKMGSNGKHQINSPEMVKSSILPKSSEDFQQFPYGTKNNSDYKNSKTTSKSADKNGIPGSGNKAPFNADFRIRTQGKRVSEVAQKMLAQQNNSNNKDELPFVMQGGPPTFAAVAAAQAAQADHKTPYGLSEAPSKLEQSLCDSKLTDTQHSRLGSSDANTRLSPTNQGKLGNYSPKNNAVIGSGILGLNQKLLKPEPGLVRKLLQEEKDERYRYLVKHGLLHYVEKDTMTLLVELKQIPHIWIVYRRPSERENQPDKMILDGRQLKHIPLLEGEERVKYLCLSNNEIQKLENFVSLPNLNFLDLSQNMIQSINSFPVSTAVQKLRVLILSKNRIENISNMEVFSNLDVLDLQDNRIKKIENINCLQQLRVLNLANNQLEKLEFQTPLKNLVEINLRKNQITEITTPLTLLPALQKVYLSHNKLSIFFESAGVIAGLTDLTLDGNSCEKQTGFITRLKGMYPSLVYYNLKKLSDQLTPIPTPTQSAVQVAASQAPPSNQKLVSQTATATGTDKKPEPSAQVLEAEKNLLADCPGKPIISPEYAHLPHPILPFKPKNECNVVQIIQKEWNMEVERLNSKKNAKVPKMYAHTEKSLVQSGHAEIESNRILYIYGNALEVLQRAEFYDQVEEIHLIYVRFDLIVYHQHLDKLKQFKNLKKLVLANNYLNSFILLSKIESLNMIDQIWLYDNEILKCMTLKSFLVYRFQHLKKFNGSNISPSDKTIAKQQFQLFDKILSIQNLFARKPYSAGGNIADPNKRQMLRHRSKKHGEIATDVTRVYTAQCCTRYHQKGYQDLGNIVENTINDLVMETTNELVGDRQSMEEALKRDMKMKY